jgi:hypothetical protein
MLDASCMTEEDREKNRRKVVKLEMDLHEEEKKRDGLTGRIEAYNNTHSSFFFDALAKINKDEDQKLEIELNWGRLPAPLEGRMIRGYSHVHLEESEESPFGLRPDMMELLVEYITKTRPFILRAHELAESVLESYAKIAQCTVFDQVYSHGDADNAFLYISHPQKDFLHRVVLDFAKNVVGEAKPTEFETENMGMYRRRKIRNEGRKASADVYLVHNPGELLSIEERAHYTLQFLLAAYDAQKPEVAARRARAERVDE